MTPLQPVLAQPSPRLAAARPHPPQPGIASPIQPPRPLRQINRPTATGELLPDQGGRPLSRRTTPQPQPQAPCSKGGHQDEPRAQRGPPQSPKVPERATP